MNTPKQIANYIARQKGWVKANNLKAGDLLLVLKKHEPNTKGWHSYSGWSERKTQQTVGRIVTFESIYEKSILAGGWLFPYTVLRKIEVKKEGDIWEKEDIIFSKLQNNFYKIKKVNERYLHGGIIPMLEVYNTTNTVLYLDPVNCRFATKQEIIDFYTASN